MACVSLQDLHPYFQVLVYHYSGDDIPVTAISTYVAEEYRSVRHEFTFRRIATQPVLGYEVQHMYPPTWLKGESASQTKNSEHDLVLIYRKDDYVFVHISCEKLTNAMLGYFSTANGFQPVNADLIMGLITSTDVQLRTIGIQNVYGSSGVVPQSKVYSGRDMREALSGTTDGGYSFEHAMGVRIDQTSLKPKPIGCSLNKNKIWMSWSSDLTEFTSKCDELVDAFQHSAGQGLSVLATPVSPNGLQLDPVFFSMDYYVHKKGLLLISARGSTPSGDWSCAYSGNNEVELTINGSGAPSVKVNLQLTRNPDDTWILSYSDPTKTVSASFLDEDSDAPAGRSIDLVKYLEANPIYTIICSSGLAYRRGRYYQDNRYTSPFGRAETVIPWTGIDITAESRKPNRTDTIGDAIVQHFQNALIGIDDDGAGEVADYIVVPNGDTLVLVHAKYSSEATPGLRVDDLQVVCSQAVKNLPYFTASRLSRKIPGWSSRDFTAAPLDQVHFESTMLGVVSRMPSLDKELWIVQPGIKKTRLDAAPQNKIHVLLNHVDALCRQAGIRFRFMCSP